LDTRSFQARWGKYSLRTGQKKMNHKLKKNKETAGGGSRRGKKTLVGGDGRQN